MKKYNSIFFVPEPLPQTTNLTFHNLSTYNLTSDDYQLLDKGLTFSPTQHQQTSYIKYYAALTTLQGHYASNTCVLMHSNHKPHQERLKPTTTSYIYRNMKFLPKNSIETPLERYTGVSKLESYHPRNSIIYRIRHPLTCTSSNVVYLITCTSNEQYVGCTTHQLNIRMNHHRSNIFNPLRIYISQHFNLPGHITNQHLKVQPIDSANNAKYKIQELYHLERFWIRTLRTLPPHGLNISSGNTGIYYNHLYVTHEM